MESKKVDSVEAKSRMVVRRGGGENVKMLQEEGTVLQLYRITSLAI